MSVAISAFVLTATMLASGPAAAIAQSGPGATSAARTACSLITPQEIGVSPALEFVTAKRRLCRK